MRVKSSSDVAKSKFGKLQPVRSFIVQKSDRRRRYWVCVCDCGNEITIPEHRFLYEDKEWSCGCAAWKPLNLTDVQIGYLTGLIDGEGCLGISKDKKATKYGFRYNAMLTIGMTNKFIIDLIDEFGIGTYYIRPSQRPGWKETYIWQIGPGWLRRLLPMIVSLLRVKKRQAEIIIELLKSSQNLARAVDEKLAAHLERAEKLYCEIRILNRKGKSHGK